MDRHRHADACAFANPDGPHILLPEPFRAKSGEVIVGSGAAGGLIRIKRCGPADGPDEAVPKGAQMCASMPPGSRNGHFVVQRTGQAARYRESAFAFLTPVKGEHRDLCSVARKPRPSHSGFEPSVGSGLRCRPVGSNEGTWELRDMATPEPRPGDALVVVDLQRDFLPGGPLAVPHADRVVPAINRYLDRFAGLGLPVFATRDWHPDNHCSFASQGGPWPPHCIAGSAGAGFAEEARLPPATIVISKATSAERDAYSGFAGTDLEIRLRTAGVRRLFVTGVATDYCVLQTVLDARARGYEVVVLTDAIAAVELRPGDGQRALDSMRAAGAMLCAPAQPIAAG